MSAADNNAHHGLSFKHFSLLRRAIVQKRTGMLHFRTVDDYSGVLLFSEGQIGHDDSYKQLTKFCISPMILTEWHDGRVQVETVPALQAMVYVTDHLTWNTGQLRMVSVMFSKLPSVSVTLLDVHFESFLTDISYNLFYQQSLSVEGFTPAYFLLDNDPSNSLLLHRVRVLIFNYVLGLMQAAKVVEEPVPDVHHVKPKESFGFIGRIMRRIRGIH